MGVVLLAGLIFTVFLKVICMIPYQQEEVEITVQSLGIGVYIMVICLMAFAVQILMIIRFYSTMVGDRGYLTWTLPASSYQHIGAKLLGSVIWKLLVGLGMLVMLVIFFVGKYWFWMEDLTGSNMYDVSNIDIIKWIIQNIIQEIWGTIKPEDILMICIQGLSAFIWSLTALLMIYMCIAIGQLFGKWRILMSIGSYFGIMILLEIVGTVAITVMAWYSDSRAGMKQTMVLGYPTGVWGTTIGSLLGGLVTGLVLFFITNYIFKKHLNLE